MATLDRFGISPIDQVRIRLANQRVSNCVSEAFSISCSAPLPHKAGSESSVLGSIARPYKLPETGKICPTRELDALAAAAKNVRRPLGSRTPRTFGRP